MRQKSKCGEQLIRADNSQVYDRKGYLDRVLSSSYSLQESEGDEMAKFYRTHFSALWD